MINTYCWKSHKICSVHHMAPVMDLTNCHLTINFDLVNAFCFCCLAGKTAVSDFFFLEKKTLPSWIKTVDILLPLLIHLSHDITADCLIVLNSSHHVSQSLVVLQEIIRESVVRVVVSVFLKIERMRWFYQESNWFIIIVYNLIKLNSAICNC